MYSLPHIRRSKEKKRALFLSAVFILTPLLLIGVLIYRNQLFNIRLIHINGAKEFQNQMFVIAKDYMRYTISNTKPLREAILSQMPSIERVDARSNIFTRELFITYALRAPILRWCNEAEGTLCYAIDKKGVIFNRIAPQSDIPAMGGAYLKDIAIGKKFPERFLTPIETILDAFDRNKISVSSFIFDASYELRAKTSLAPELLFSLEIPIESQLNAFFLLSDKLGKEKIVTLRYIDLRIPNKVYYQ